MKRSLTVAALIASAGFASAANVSSAAPFESRLNLAVLQAISERCGIPPADLDLRLFTVSPPAGVDSTAALRVEIPANDDGIGATTVRVATTRIDGTPVSFPVPANVDAWADVLVTSRRIDRHQSIGPGTTTRQRMLITNAVASSIRDDAALTGMRATRTMMPGQIVDSRWLEPIPDIHKGSRVTLAYEVGGVRVSTSGIAMEDGYISQPISIKPQNGRQLIQAIVLDEHTVRPGLR